MRIFEGQGNKNDGIHEILDNNDYMLDLCARMAHYSTAIEGNTLTPAQSKSMIVDNYTPTTLKECKFYEVCDYRYLTSPLVELSRTN